MTNLKNKKIPFQNTFSKYLFKIPFQKRYTKTKKQNKNPKKTKTKK